MFFASIATTMHWLPNFSAPSLTILRSAAAAELIEILSAPADRQRHETGFRGSLYRIEQCPATLVTCPNIEKAEFIGACGIIGDGAFDGIAGITKIDKIDALHHASLFHV
jgi:hypothetical protein